MNSRIENGTPTLPSKEEIIAEVNYWLKTNEIQDVNITEEYIGYRENDGMLDSERKIYFPETNTIDRLKEHLIYDDKVSEYLNIIKRK